MEVFRGGRSDRKGASADGFDEVELAHQLRDACDYSAELEADLQFAALPTLAVAFFIV